jgi:hypothetical protein
LFVWGIPVLAENTLNENPSFVAELAGSYAAAGQRDEAAQLLDQLNEVSKLHYVPAYYLTLVHAALKETDPAFDWP